jgi:hypothetical protein
MANQSDPEPSHSRRQDQPAESREPIDSAQTDGPTHAGPSGVDGIAADATPGNSTPAASRDVERSDEACLVRVVTVAGAPVSGARVRVYSPDLRGPVALGEFRPERFREAAAVTEITDERGEVTLPSRFGAGCPVLVAHPSHADAVGELTADEIVDGVSRFTLGDKGRVFGRVLDGMSGKPLAGVTLIATRLFPIDQLQIESKETTWRALTAIRAESAVDGQFNLDGLPAADGAVIWMFAPKYPTRRVVGVYPAPFDQLLRIYAGGAVTGRVLDDEGNPIKEVVISAALCGVTPIQELERTKSSADGSFSMDALPESPVMWTLRRDGFAFLNRFDALVADGRVADFVMQREVRCAGMVVDDAGQPIAGAKLRFGSDKDVFFIGDHETYDDGTFEMPWIGDGRRLLILGEAAGHAPVRLAGIAPSSNLRITLGRLGSLVGVVRDEDGAPVRPLTLATRPVVLDPAADENVGDALVWRDCDVADGGFVIDGVGPGKVDLHVVAPDGSRHVERGLEVPAGARSERYVITVPAGRRIEGRLIGADRRPIAGASVSRLIDTQLGEPSARETPSRATTGNDGGFSLGGLPDQPFTLRVTDNVHPNAFYRDLRVEDFPQELTYAATAVIDGTVLTHWSSPETAIRLNARHRGTQTRSSIPIGPDGSFRFGPIPPGRWIFEAFDEWSALSARSVNSMVVMETEIGSGESKRIELDLRGRGRIEGALTGVPGFVALRCFAIRATPVSSIESMSCRALTTLEPDGSFVLCNLPFGRVRLELQNLLPGYGGCAFEEVELTDERPDARVSLRWRSTEIKGRVMDGAGAPVPAELRVVATDDEAELLRMLARHDGAFELAPPESRSFSIIASAPGFADAPSESFDADRLPTDPLEFVLEPEARVTLKVADDSGVAVAGAEVRLAVAGDRAGAGFSDMPARATRTGADGRVVIVRLPAGVFQLSVRADGAPLQPPRTIDLDWGESSALSVVVTRFGSIVVVAARPDGTPRAGIAVTLKQRSDPGDVRFATTNDVGRAVFDDVAVGDWYVSSGDAQPVPLSVRAGVPEQVSLIDDG